MYYLSNMTNFFCILTAHEKDAKRDDSALGILTAPKNRNNDCESNKPLDLKFE